MKILSAIPKGTTLEEVKKLFILCTLKQNNGNKSQTSRDLGISIRCLRDRLKRQAEEERNIKKFRKG